MAAEPVSLPALVLARVWEWEGYSNPPGILGAAGHVVPSRTRQDFEDGVLAVLGELGLAANGLPVPALRRAIALLAGAPRSFLVRSDFGAAGQNGGGAGGMLVAGDGTTAVRLICGGEQARIEWIPGDAPSYGLVTRLPRYAPASIRPMAVARSAVSPGRNAESGDAGAVDPVVGVSANNGSGDADRLLELMGGQRLGVHQLCVLDGQGRRSTPLTVVDLTETGRIVTFVVERPDAPDEVHCLPGSPEQLARLLDTM